MNRNVKIDGLTEMEGAVLAVISRQLSATAYYVKEEFRQSPSDFWSGSAGAVYPLVKRLEARGLLSSEDESDGARPKRLFRVTDVGHEVLVSWLTDVDRACSVGYDPLRTRLFFSELLDAGQLEDFLSEASECLSKDSPPPASASPLALLLHETWVSLRRESLNAFMRVCSKK